MTIKELCIKYEKCSNGCPFNFICHPPNGNFCPLSFDEIKNTIVTKGIIETAKKLQEVRRYND